jgi:hypothetical protein
MPLCSELNICPFKFNISKFICCRTKEKEEEPKIADKDFKLIKRTQRRYKNLIPYDGNFAYLKILYDGNILCYSGEDLFASLGVSKECLDKSLTDAKKCHILFREYISPVFEECIKDGEIYQFDFGLNDEEYSCCFYPCPLPMEYISVDIVIRISQHITFDEIKNFIVKPFIPTESIIESEDSEEFKEIKSSTI